MQYVVEGGDSPETLCDFDGTKVRVVIPSNEVHVWAETGQVGLGSELPLENGSKLSILIEKDFQCLTVRPGEDETDMFPNPLTPHKDQ